MKLFILGIKPHFSFDIQIIRFWMWSLNRDKNSVFHLNYIVGQENCSNALKFVSCIASTLSANILWGKIYNYHWNKMAFKTKTIDLQILVILTFLKKKNFYHKILFNYVIKKIFSFCRRKIFLLFEDYFLFWKIK